MKSILIATDSHSGILPQEAERLGVRVLPMPFFFGEECFFEGVSITREDFFDRLRAGEAVSTSQPSPEAVMEFWREGLKEYDEIVYIPMSSGLSGSCNTAKMLALEEEFLDRVFVVDNGRVSTLLERTIYDALEMKAEGYGSAEIKEALEAAREDMVIYIAVDTMDRLVKGGRVSATTALLGTMLNIKPVLKFTTGILDTYKKCRGMKKAKKEMLEAIENDMQTTFREFYERDEIYLVAAGSASKEETEAWINEIKAYFPGREVLYGDLSLGLSCHIGEGGLGIGLSCRPHRNEIKDRV